MRRPPHCSAWLTLAALAIPCSASPQAALTPADSAILASQPLKRLVLAPSLLRRVSLLAAGLDREVVLCLRGTVAGGGNPPGKFLPALPPPMAGVAESGGRPGPDRQATCTVRSLEACRH